MECREEKIARRIAGKWASGSIAAVRSGSETHQKQSGVRVTEARNWLTPVAAVAVRAFAFASDFGGVSAQSRTAPAAQHRSIDSI
jgi:hypothetical protein